ncbi:hypothetical protein N431DRAFT_510878 [Stipitochalara longipes BDJ]|nr:hypothetical protein N431DRAFT_510878 [Stipitochalara longipes BDJ]
MVNPSPTLSVYCASPTSGMICGLANGNILDPVALNEDDSDMSPVSSPGDCYQRCLANPSCKSYFTSQWINSTAWNCDIFRNTLKNNVVSAVSGSNFFDRGCPDYLPSQCNRTDARAPVPITTYPSLPADSNLPGWDPGSTPFLEVWSSPSTVIVQVPSPTSTSTSYYFNPMTIEEEPPWTPPALTTQQVSRRAPEDTTVFIGITLEPSDFSSLIPFPTNSIPDSFDPFNPPTSTIPFTIGGGRPKTTTIQPLTTTIYTTINPPTVVNRPPPSTVITIFSTLAPTVCINRANPTTANKQPPPLTSFNHKGRALVYTAMVPDCVSQNPPNNNNNNNNNPNHYTSLINPSTVRGPQATSIRAGNSQPRPLTSFNHQARAVDGFVPNYSTVLPDYLKNWYVDYYGAIIPQACSCLITSPAAETTIHATTTQYFSVYYVSIVYLERSSTPAATEFVTPYLTTTYLTIA